MPLVDVTMRLLLSVPASTEAEALTFLEGVTGRGKDQFGAKLADWLLSNNGAFPEPVDVEEVDHPQDAGVDVLLTGLATKTPIGFQIKSDNDLSTSTFADEQFRQQACLHAVSQPLSRTQN